jgi:hypothetical protein
MHVTRYAFAVTTNASGAATVYSDAICNGVVHQVRYVPHGSTPLDTGADVDLTGEVSGLVVLDQDNIGTAAYTVAPRQATHTTAAVAALYAAGGTAVLAPVAVAGERLKLVVASGGDTKSGTYYVWVG